MKIILIPICMALLLRCETFAQYNYYDPIGLYSAPSNNLGQDLGYQYNKPEKSQAIKTSLTPNFGYQYIPPSSPFQYQKPSLASLYSAPREEVPIITKQFYIHSAPEDKSNFGKTKHFKIGRSQKNYRVIFIKAPSSDSSKTRLTAEYAPNEDKTVIYVLSKKEHEIDVNDIATPPPTVPSKPEVFFIKYKTSEEAAHAQSEIQAKYDALGGSSSTINNGNTPVTSVIGSLDKSAGSDGLQYNNLRSEAKSAFLNENYLPANY